MGLGLLPNFTQFCLWTTEAQNLEFRNWKQDRWMTCMGGQIDRQRRCCTTIIKCGRLFFQTFTPPHVFNQWQCRGPNVRAGRSFLKLSLPQWFREHWTHLSFWHPEKRGGAYSQQLQMEQESPSSVCDKAGEGRGSVGGQMAKEFWSNSGNIPFAKCQHGIQPELGERVGGVPWSYYLKILARIKCPTPLPP